MPYFSSLFLKKVLKVRLFCPQRYCTKAVERVRPPSTFFAESTSFPPFFLYYYCHMFRPFPLGSVSLLGATKVPPPPLPLSRLHSLPLPAQRRKRRRPLLLLPTAQHTLTHFTKNGEEEGPILLNPSSPPRQTSFSPKTKTSSSSLERPPLSKKSSRGRGKRGADGSRIYLLQ